MRNLRTSSAVGLAAGLLLAGASVVLAQDSATLTVAQDGSGDYDDIASAVAAAADGDTVIVRPGTYEQGLHIDKAITLSGDGSREQIVIAPAAGTEITHETPWGEEIPVGVWVDGVDATLERLTLAFDGEYLGLLLTDGAALVEDVSISGSDIVMPSGEPVFRDSVIDAYFAVRGGSPTVEDSEIIGHASVDGPGRTVIRRSTLSGGTSASAEAIGSYEDNLFVGQQLAIDTGSDMLVKGNTVRDITDNQAGILVVDDGSTAQIVDNTVERAAIGISVDSNEPGSSIAGNTIRDVRVGIHVESKAATRITDNEIEDARTFGILLQNGQPVVEGNRICGTGEAFEFRDGTDPDIGANEICEDGEV